MDNYGIQNVNMYFMFVLQENISKSNKYLFLYFWIHNIYFMLNCSFSSDYLLYQTDTVVVNLIFT